MSGGMGGPELLKVVKRIQGATSRVAADLIMQAVQNAYDQGYRAGMNEAKGLPNDV